MPSAPVVNIPLGPAVGRVDDGVDWIAVEGLVVDGLGASVLPELPPSVEVGAGSRTRSSSAPTMPAGISPAAGMEPGATTASASRSRPRRTASAKSGLAVHVLRPLLRPRVR